MKLFNDNLTQTEKGKELDKEITRSIQKIIKENSDCSLIEIQYLFTQVLTLEISRHVLENQVKARKNK